MRPSSRDRMVEVALDTAAVAQGTEVTLDAVARAAACTTDDADAVLAMIDSLTR